MHRFGNWNLLMLYYICCDFVQTAGYPRLVQHDKTIVILNAVKDL